MEVENSINLKAGKVIQGKYEVLRCLGAGSMGMVYAVKHLDLQDRILAMKVLYSDVAKDEVQAARFKNEIVASYEVNHPNVVRAYDYFKEGDLIAYTMEYVAGGDLADRLNEEELISIADSISMLKQMASGLFAIHKVGIIHRDLKPENILLSNDASIKITDFGIARSAKGPRLTDHGGIVGTFAYVSPEYLEHGTLDNRSDIYSIGVLAYEMVVGSAPHDGNNVIESMHAKLSTDPKEPVHLRNGCPKSLSNVIMKALARDPKERFQTAQELLVALDSIVLEETEQEKKADVVVQGAKESKEEPRVLSSKSTRKVFDSEIGNMLQGLKDSLDGHPAVDPDYPLNDSNFLDASVTYQQPVTISQGRLSAERFKALQEDIGIRKKKVSGVGAFESIFMGLLIFATGTVVGLVTLKYTSFPLFSSVLAVIRHYLGA